MTARSEGGMMGSSPLPPSQSYGKVHIHGDARAHLGNSYIVNNFGSGPDMRQIFLASLSYPQIFARRAQISNACPDTYRWVLNSPRSVPQSWDCFRTWSLARDDTHGIYWISGKPGSGKSTLMKYLDENIDDERDLAHWADEKTVVRLSHFFWNSGNNLQRSTEGLLRHLVLQILDQFPELFDCVIQYCRGMTVGDLTVPFSVAALADVVKYLLSIQQAEAKFFFIIDGLDECEDYNAPNTELLNYLSDFSAFTNVKLCVSSRLLNIFQDAFAQCPQFRLEYLTYLDMHTFVSSKLRANSRWRYLWDLDHEQASSFIGEIVTKAEGVFLWAALVVRNILNGLRDGDNPDELFRRLNDIPADLENYFTRIVASIEEQHRCEASILFQLASWEEDKYMTLTPFRLVDMIFLSMPSEILDLESRSRSFVSYFENPHRSQFVVDSLERKLNSRSKGLLECTGETDMLSLAPEIPGQSPSPQPSIKGQDDGETASASAHGWLDRATRAEIAPIHRSLRDFLLMPRTRTLLHRYTNGQPIDARSWLVEARVVRLMALTSLSYQGDYLAGGLSSLICSMSADGPSDRSTSMISHISSIVEHFASKCRAKRYWYIRDSFEQFNREQGTFLTLAIDFELTPYVLANMTPTVIRAKQGIPILDHILRPRYASRMDIAIFNRFPNIVVLEAALRQGADPNERIEGESCSVWAAYLHFLVDFIFTFAYSRSSVEAHLSWVQALNLLITHGASPMLPVQWFPVQEVIDTRGQSRWEEVLATAIITDPHSHEETISMYTVKDLLRNLQAVFACDITTILQDLEAREVAMSSSAL